MSSYYIFDSKKENSGGVTEKFVKDEDKKNLDLAATRQMTGDLDMGDNSIVGFININASNSATTKSWQEGKFLPFTGGTMTGDLSLGGRKLLNLGSDLTGTSAVTKAYVDGEILKISNTVKRYNVYNYTFGCGELTHNSWVYPNGPRNRDPHIWMNISGLDEYSWFELGTHIFDNDDPITGTLTIEYRLECMESSGTLRSWIFFIGNLNGYRLPSEKFFCINLRKKFSDFPTGNYKQFKIARLSIKRKWSGTQGNENSVTFAIGKV